MPSTKKEAPHVLVLRSCFKDMTCSNGVKYPEKGKVTCKKWNPSPNSKTGLTGFLWGCGDPNLANWFHDPKWILMKVSSKDIVDLGSCVRFPRGEVILAGSLKDCTDKLLEYPEAQSKPIMGVSRKIEQDSVRVQGGYKSVIEAGNDTTIVGGDRSTLRGGAHATILAGHLSQLTAEDNATLEAGNYSVLTAGNKSSLHAGYQSVLRAKADSTLIAGSGSSLTAGDNSKLTAGDRSSLCAGIGSTLTWKVGKKSHQKIITDQQDANIPWICIKGQIIKQ